ncbi:MFS transporter [Sorangium sp. So ce1151]|uniref:MFS transporter n=1 Tax=Sorangium sp. So ce1151 TaxID=3133332 RepID=UPI003F622603
MSTLITEWNPDDDVFWEKTGKRIARRNLIWSIVAENIGFSVWLLWSVTATRLPKVGFNYTTDQLFLLVAIPGLVGALIRFPYTFAVPKFGGRNWTVVSALLLLIPTILLSVLVTRPDTPFWLMALAAATAGLGGGNFASSMANISFFYPDKKKGLALGLNAAGGNVGVSNVQLIVPILVGPGAVATAIGGYHTESGIYLQNAGLMWIPLILLAAAGAYFFMNNLASAKSNFKDQMAATRNKHTWIVAWLYIGTFGSFIGYSAALPLLLKMQFPAVTLELTFMGALIGSVARPLGGYLADKIGGARITFCNFVVMGLASLGIIHFLDEKSYAGVVTMFMLMFIAAGIGNGSTFRMVPVLFRRDHLRAVQGRGEAARVEALNTARRQSAAVLGFTSAIGALGGFFIPRSFGASIKATGGATTALSYFFVFYVTCMALTWWCYLRTRFLVNRIPSLAEADA